MVSDPLYLKILPLSSISPPSPSTHLRKSTHPSCWAHILYQHPCQHPKYFHHVRYISHYRHLCRIVSTRVRLSPGNIDNSCCRDLFVTSNFIIKREFSLGISYVTCTIWRGKKPLMFHESKKQLLKHKLT